MRAKIKTDTIQAATAILDKLNKSHAVTVGRTNISAMLLLWIVALSAQSCTTTCVLERKVVKTDQHIFVDSVIRTMSPHQAITRVKSQQCDITFKINFISFK